MAAYEARFPACTSVRIADRADLEAFRARWQLHNPLAIEQLAFAGQRAIVKEVGFYHGGDSLYALVDVPGVWHEDCLRSGSEPPAV